ncbi:MAG: DegT/DnrJ/EryC1/StrS family aminotransferase [Bacteroidales bacterium]|nr:DegT/DnrJ/EryC1/StrS family aminotransferase [Bacteroidales bacterium]
MKISKNPIFSLDFFNHKYFTYNARTAFSIILKNNFSHQGTILLPSYIGITDKEGSGVLDPILETQVNYDFYEIGEDFKVDEIKLYEKLDSQKFEAILIIHYFGFCHIDIVRLQLYCKKNNIIIIEDCAHAFDSKYKSKLLGSYGDYSFFSIHKYLPCNNGGVLKINGKVSEYILENNSIQFEDFQALNAFSLDEIAKVRKANYKRLVTLLSEVDNIQILFPNLEEGIVPMNLPIIVKGNLRERLYFYLIEKNIETTALYYRLIDQIDKLKFKSSHYLSQNILNLPIHQGIKENDIKNMAKTIKEFFKLYS